MMKAQKTWSRISMFAIAGLSAAYAVSGHATDNGEEKTVEDRAYVYQTVASATLGESESWDDETTMAQRGKHYALDVEKIDGATSAIIFMPTSVNTKGAAYEFTGESLTLNAGCSLRFPVENVDNIIFKCKELNMNDGSSVMGGGNQAYYTIDGGTINLSGTVRFNAAAGRNVRLRSNIAGDGHLKLCGWNTGSVPYATYYLRGDNRNFMGVIDMTMNRVADASFDAKFSILNISNVNQLGGNLPELNRKALVLTHYVQLLVDGNVAMGKDLNRGVAVMRNAQINLPNATTFVMETPLSLNGELRKIGVGTLVLKGAAIGFGSDGLSEDPTAGKNIISMRGGTLAIGSVDAINGASVTFESGTQFELRPNFGDAELMNYGIRNVKTSSPFALGEGVTALPFSIGAATGKPTGGVPFRLGLFTVKSGSDAVALIRTAVANIEYPVAGCNGKLVEVLDEEADAMTFAIDYTPIGFCLSIR